MATNTVISISPEEYLKLDSEAERPSEFLDGQMVEVEAATWNHSTIATNLSNAIASSLKASKSKCRVNSQVRVHTPSTGLYAYPDLVMTCGNEILAKYDTLMNPVLIIEVLSPSTHDYDLGRKFAAYRSIPSLKEYWTVAQNRPHVAQWTIVNSHWTLTEHSSLDALITHGDIHVSILDIYRDVHF